MKNRTTKILIIRRSALGDTIHTLPLAKALRDKFQDAQIDWIVEDKASQFIVGNPLLNNVYVLHKKTGGLREFFSVISKIRKEKYDIVIDTQQLFKSAVIMGLSGAKRKITLSDGREFSGIFANEIIKTGRKQFDINYHVVKRNLEIAKYLDADFENVDFVFPKFSSENILKVKELMKDINPALKTVVIAPETTWENKHWIVDGWKEVLSELIGKVNIVYTGTMKDKGLCEAILSGFADKNIINLRGKTNLSELAEVFKLSDLVISPDSGSAHIAWATGIPYVITLFFATSSNRTAPFGEKYFSFQSEAKCSPCMKKNCKNAEKNKCIFMINSKNIVKLVNKLLQFEE